MATGTGTQIAVAVIGVVGVLGGAFLAYTSAGLQSDIDALNAQIRGEELALNQSRFKSEQQARKDEILKTYVPKLLNRNESDRTEAVVIFRLLFPNDTADILLISAQALSEGEARALELAIDKAEELDKTTGSWAIVIGSDSTQESAQDQADRAEKEGYSPVMIYKQGEELFSAAISAFPNQVEAETVVFDVRAQIRESASVVNLNTWCANPVDLVDTNGYIECAAGQSEE